PSTYLISLTLHDALPIWNGRPQRGLSKKFCPYVRTRRRARTKVAAGYAILRGVNQAGRKRMVSQGVTNAIHRPVRCRAAQNCVSDRKSTRLNSSHVEISY